MRRAIFLLCVLAALTLTVGCGVSKSEFKSHVEAQELRHNELRAEISRLSAKADELDRKVAAIPRDVEEVRAALRASLEIQRDALRGQADRLDSVLGRVGRPPGTP